MLKKTKELLNFAFFIIVVAGIVNFVSGGDMLFYFLVSYFSLFLSIPLFDISRRDN